MNIRPTQPADALRIAEIHVRTWQAAYRGIVPDGYLNSLSIERYENMWSPHIGRGSPELLVASEGESILGCVAFGRSRDEGAEPNVAEIWAIHVAHATKSATCAGST